MHTRGEMNISSRAQALSHSAIAEMGDLARQSAGPGARAVIDLSEGDPSFATPPRIIDEAVEGLRKGLTHYGSVRGLPALRECLLGQKEFQGADYRADANIVVTPGAKFALYAALMCLVDPGDRVVVIDPSWVSYDQMIRLAGGVPVHLRTTAGGRFFPELGDGGNLASAKAWIINTPHNPTARVYEEGELARLLRAAADTDSVIISDEIYKDVVFDAAHVSAARFAEFRDRVVVVGGFSKTYAMTGWRLGYVVGPQTVLAKIAQFQQHTATCAAPFVQYAGIAAMTSAAVKDAVNTMLTEYEERRRAVQTAIDAMGAVDLAAMEGTFYAWLGISRLGVSSRDFALRLLREHDVSVVPGIAFGESGEGWIRLCYGHQGLEILSQALGRLGDFVGRLG